MCLCCGADLQDEDVHHAMCAWPTLERMIAAMAPHERGRETPRLTKRSVRLLRLHPPFETTLRALYAAGCMTFGVRNDGGEYDMCRYCSADRGNGSPHATTCPWPEVERLMAPRGSRCRRADRHYLLAVRVHGVTYVRRHSGWYCNTKPLDPDASRPIVRVDRRRRRYRRRLEPGDLAA